MLAKTSFEPVSHDFQGVDAGPATNRSQSSLSPHIVIAESKQVSIEAGNSHSIHGIVFVPDSSVPDNQNEIIPSLDTAIADISAEIHEPSNSSDIATATVEDSPPATNSLEIFRFLDLASETRNRIYHFVLGPPQDPSICLTEILDKRPFRALNGGVDIEQTFRPKSVVQNPEHKDPEWGVTHQVKPHDLSILLVSKQIYMEAFHVLYATNCFFFTDTGLLYRFLKNIGYIRRQQLTMIYFLWRGPDAKEAFRLLKTCRRLRLVQFTVPCSHPPGYEALKEVKVEKAKARALIHFASAQNPPLTIHDHTSCFGDYQCHCLCRRSYEPASNLQELEGAMMRPRRAQDLPSSEENCDLFKPKRECFKKSEEQNLLQEKATFDDFISRIEQQGKELKYLGRRNKATEAAMNQTLIGPDADDYFRDFADKLARDKRLLKKKEYWTAKLQKEQEIKEREIRLRREAKEEKEREIEMRWEARELKLKTAREAREHAKKVAREARELKRRTAREAKEREKMMAREVRAQKKAAREAAGRDKKTTM